MSDLAGPGGVEGWLKRADRELRILAGNVAKARVPRTCTSTARPDVRKVQPGVLFLETDTNRLIYANATQTGWVNALGQAV